MPMLDTTLPVNGHAIRVVIDEMGYRTLFFDGEAVTEAGVKSWKGTHVFQRPMDGSLHEFKLIMQVAGLLRCRCRLLVDGVEVQASEHKLSLASAGKANWLWSSIKTPLEADKAIVMAFNFGVCSAVLTLILSILPLFGFSLFGMGLEGLFDVAIMAGLLVGLKKKSRVCAVLLFAYFILSKLIFLAMSGMGSPGIGGMILFGAVFLNGVRGTFARRKLAAT